MVWFVLAVKIRIGIIIGMVISEISKFLCCMLADRVLVKLVIRVRVGMVADRL